MSLHHQNSLHHQLDFQTRALVIGIVIGINSLACILFGFHDDIKTGTPMSLLRTTSVPTGENNSFVVS